MNTDDKMCPTAWYFAGARIAQPFLNFDLYFYLDVDVDVDFDCVYVLRLFFNPIDVDFLSLPFFAALLHMQWSVSQSVGQSVSQSFACNGNQNSARADVRGLIYSFLLRLFVLIDFFFFSILLSILFSILFYSILFYSILFYSILFYSSLVVGRRKERKSRSKKKKKEKKNAKHNKERISRTRTT